MTELLEKIGSTHTRFPPDSMTTDALLAMRSVAITLVSVDNPCIEKARMTSKLLSMADDIRTLREINNYCPGKSVVIGSSPQP